MSIKALKSGPQKWEPSKVAHNGPRPFYFTVQPRPKPTANNCFFILLMKSRDQATADKYQSNKWQFAGIESYFMDLAGKWPHNFGLYYTNSAILYTYLGNQMIMIHHLKGLNVLIVPILSLPTRAHCFMWRGSQVAHVFICDLTFIYFLKQCALKVN